MSFTTRLAESGHSPVFVQEFDGDILHAMASATGWSTSTDGVLSTTTTRVREGAGAIQINKTGTTQAFVELSRTGLALDASMHSYLSFWIYLASVADVVSLTTQYGIDASNYQQVVKTQSTTKEPLVAGWNQVFISMDANTYSGDTASVVGVPVWDNLGRLYWKLTLSGTGDTLSGTVIGPVNAHPFRWSSAQLTNPRAPYISGVLRPPAISPHRSRVQDGILSSAAATVRILDSEGGWGADYGLMYGGEGPLLADLTDVNLLGRIGRIRMGFRTDNETDANFQSIFVGIVDSLEHEGRSWSLELSDFLRLLEVPFAGAATEAAPLTITGNLITVMLKLMLSTGNATNNGGGAGTYDTLSANNGAGVSAWLVDVAGLETERDEQLYLEDVSFTFIKPQESLLIWVFDQCKAHGLSPRVTPAGLFSMRKVRPTFGTETTTAVGRSSIILDGKLPKFRHDRSDLYNQVRIEYSYTASTDVYASSATVTDATSVARYGLRELAIKSQGITTQVRATTAGRRILRRLGDGSPPVTLEAMMQLQATGLGDLVALTDPRSIPDIAAATYGVAGVVAEVTERVFNPANRYRMTFMARRTAFRQGNYRKIHPAGAAVYDSQTAAAKANYGSISDGTSLGTAADAEHEIGAG